MITILKIIKESILQALQQLRANKLRSFLSLLGISIGIFSIIGVLSAVDSLEDNIKGSLDKLGSDVVYVSKWPWANIGGDWWKYMRRPNPDYNDFKAINKNSHNKDLSTFYVRQGGKTLKYGQNNVQDVEMLGVTEEFSDLFSLAFDSGRFFSSAEYRTGSNKIVLGAKVSDELFGDKEPLGKDVKLLGKKYEVIGILEKAGEGLINPLDFDDSFIISYPNIKGFVNVKNTNRLFSVVAVKAKDGIALDNLKDEITGVIRSGRHLKPTAASNFSVNELSMVTRVFDSFFIVLNILGIVIGFFSLLVGGVSVANIMFVSVKERTRLIGIKKAIGAKRFVILLEFLIESVILCFLGGIIGLIFVYLITFILTQVIGFELYLNFFNILLGVLVSILIGVISGVIPAWQAARMDAVEAMRN